MVQLMLFVGHAYHQPRRRVNRSNPHGDAEQGVAPGGRPRSLRSLGPPQVNGGVGAPLAYDDARHGFRLTDETYTLPPVRLSRREAFSFALARKLLAHYEGTPLHMDMRSVLDKIAESLVGDITLEPDWLSEHVGVLLEDLVRIVRYFRLNH
jgi:hypothetical protein